MDASLRRRLGSLMAGLASDILELIGHSSVEDLLAETAPAPRRGGRREAVRVEPRGPRKAVPRRPSSKGRRQPTIDRTSLAEHMVEVVREHPAGLRADEIRGKLPFLPRVPDRLFQLALGDAVRSGRLSKAGQRRATRYSVGEGMVPRPQRGGGARTGDTTSESGPDLAEARGQAPEAHEPVPDGGEASSEHGV